MKTTRILFALVLAVLFLLTACGGGAPTTELVPETGKPTEELQPTAETPSLASAEPTSLPEATQPQFAPFCDTAPAGCESPTIEMLDNKYCIEKVPYAIMSVTAGSTYESLDSDMQCVDQMHSDGTMRVTCHSITSKQLWSYDLKVCNSACAAPALQIDTGQCPDGYGYDVSNQCCAAPPPSSGDGCITYTVDLGACLGE